MKKRFKKEFLMSAFDCGPTKYYDYKEKKVMPVDTKAFIEIKKFAHSTPEIGYISTWYRQDVPEKIERIDSLYVPLENYLPCRRLYLNMGSILFVKKLRFWIFYNRIKLNNVTKVRSFTLL